MNKVVFFIDGFNLYHAIDEQIRQKPYFRMYKWLDLSKLASLFVTKQHRIEGIYYFTALALWSPDKVKRHKVYIKALESTGVNVVYGEFRKRDKFCYRCRRTSPTFEEKRTDVNIAIWLLRLAFEDKYDTAMVVSGDSDLIPALEAVKEIFPSKQIGIVIPVGRSAELLKQIADFHMRIKEKHLKSSLLPSSIQIGTLTLSCPAEWK